MTILVTGAAGQLGHDLVNELRSRGIETVGTDIADFDITDEKAAFEYITRLSPDAVAHCAAYTAVDRAEDDKETARRINADGTRNIALACKACGAKLMYISTDYVFDGRPGPAWKPHDLPAPINVYGMTKYLGEYAVCEFVPAHFIVRISWVFGLNGKNFVKTMLRLAGERDSISVVNDQLGSPTYTKDLAVLLSDMLESDRFGTYHATNEGVCTWFDFARAILREAGMDEAMIKPVCSEEYPSRAMRPQNSVMDKSGLDKAGFNRLPHWEDALSRYIKELRDNGEA